MRNRKIKKALKRLYYLPLNKNLILYGNNKIKHFYYKVTKSTRVAFPSTIMIELTNHCNLACTICPREYEYGKNMDKGNMKVEEAKRIIDEVYPYLDSVGLTGMGETFIYKELAEMVDYIKSKNKGIIISISTNAVLPDFIEKAKKVVGKIDTIQISIDGLNEVYNSIRKNSNFLTLDNNLKLLTELCRETSTDLMLNMVVTKENYMHMADLVDYAKERQVKYLDFTIFNLASVTNEPIDYYEFYQSEEFLKEVARLEDAIKKTPEVLVTNRNFETENSFQKCPFPWTHFYISQDGYIPPCCAKPFPKEKNFGNVRDGKLIDLLNNADFQQWRKLWYENITPEFCKKCHFVGVKPIHKTSKA